MAQGEKIMTELTGWTEEQCGRHIRAIFTAPDDDYANLTINYGRLETTVDIAPDSAEALLNAAHKLGLIIEIEDFNDGTPDLIAFLRPNQLRDLLPEQERQAVTAARNSLIPRPRYQLRTRSPITGHFRGGDRGMR